MEVYVICMWTCFNYVPRFRYLGTTVTNQNLMQGDIRRGLYLGNDLYRTFMNRLSPPLLCKCVKIKLYKAVIHLVALCAYETLSGTIKEEHQVRVFERRVPRGDTGGWRRLQHEELQHFRF
jgi:hypothetical protein